MKPPSRLRAPLLEADAVSRAEATRTVPAGTVPAGTVGAGTAGAGTVGAGTQQPPISDEPTAKRTRPILPPVYRGKASGEFIRVPEAHSFSQEPTTHAKPVSRTAGEAREPHHRKAIIALAQQQLDLLPKDDERRRLLELGILRGDVSLLHGLLGQLDNK